jgi:hypothetical protein
MNKVFRHLGEVLLVILMIIACLAVGASILTVYYIVKKTERVYKFPRTICIFAAALIRMIFQPTFLCILIAVWSITIVFTILCFPLALKLFRALGNMSFD